jgi:uncharacterized membrane protein YidH (DUF202 family)
MEVIMNNKIKPEKYRKLSIAALVTGILMYLVYFVLYLRMIFFQSARAMTPIESSSVPILLVGLAIAAIVCGSIDLKRIKAGRYSNKGRGLDITGIVLGSFFILVVAVTGIFLLGKALVPH